MSVLVAASHSREEDKIDGVQGNRLVRTRQAGFRRSERGYSLELKSSMCSRFLSQIRTRSDPSASGPYFPNRIVAAFGCSRPPSSFKPGREHGHPVRSLVRAPRGRFPLTEAAWVRCARRRIVFHGVPRLECCPIQPLHRARRRGVASCRHGRTPLPASLYSIARHDSADSFNISCAHSRTASLTAFCPLRTYGSPRSSRYVERRRHMCAKGHLQEQDDGATLST
jgi:hypothetical protein